MRVGEVATAPGGQVGSMREGVLEQKFLLMGRITRRIIIS
jgi:hypothetical protein